MTKSKLFLSALFTLFISADLYAADQRVYALTHSGPSSRATQVYAIFDNVDARNPHDTHLMAFYALDFRSENIIKKYSLADIESVRIGGLHAEGRYRNERFFEIKLKGSHKLIVIHPRFADGAIFTSCRNPNRCLFADAGQAATVNTHIDSYTNTRRLPADVAKVLARQIEIDQAARVSVSRRALYLTGSQQIEVYSIDRTGVETDEACDSVLGE